MERETWKVSNSMDNSKPAYFQTPYTKHHQQGECLGCCHHSTAIFGFSRRRENQALTSTSHQQIRTSKGVRRAILFIPVFISHQIDGHLWKSNHFSYDKGELRTQAWITSFCHFIFIPVFFLIVTTFFFLKEAN